MLMCSLIDLISSIDYGNLVLLQRSMLILWFGDAFSENSNIESLIISC